MDMSLSELRELGVGDGPGGLACCDSWGLKESDTTEQLNWTELNYIVKEAGFALRKEGKGKLVPFIVEPDHMPARGLAWTWDAAVPQA